MTYVEKIKRLLGEHEILRAEYEIPNRTLIEVEAPTLAARFVELHEAVADEHLGCVDECDTCATLARIDEE